MAGDVGASVALKTQGRSRVDLEEGAALSARLCT